jgi:hypothetical protein
LTPLITVFDEKEKSVSQESSLRFPDDDIRWTKRRKMMNFQEDHLSFSMSNCRCRREERASLHVITLVPQSDDIA